MSMILYKGVDYRISLCSNDPQLEGKLEFEIYTMETQKNYDENSGNMSSAKVPVTLYSNRNDNMAQSIEFLADGTKKIFLKVYVPVSAGAGSSETVCVGVLVQHQKSPDSGFED